MNSTAWSCPDCGATSQRFTNGAPVLTCLRCGAIPREEVTTGSSDPNRAHGHAPGTAPEPSRVAIDDYGPPCACCGSLLGCYCHEYPHDDKPECPGRDIEPRPITGACAEGDHSSCPPVPTDTTEHDHKPAVTCCARWPHPPGDCDATCVDCGQTPGYFLHMPADRCGTFFGCVEYRRSGHDLKEHHQFTPMQPEPAVEPERAKPLTADDWLAEEKQRNVNRMSKIANALDLGIGEMPEEAIARLRSRITELEAQVTDLRTKARKLVMCLLDAAEPSADADTRKFISEMRAE